MAITFTCAAQNPAAYFQLEMKYYKEDGAAYLGTSPAIKTNAPGPLGEGMRRFPRRFRYLLMNKSQFQNQYEKYYPDTNKINQLYTKSLAADHLFMLYFSKLAAPFQNAKTKRVGINTETLMRVASRFFYCESVRKDSTINAYVCVNLNGLKNAFTQDHTLIEAFCFEAIFESLKVDGRPAAFITNFKKHISDAEKREKALVKDPLAYLEKIRQYCFDQMRNNSSLKDALIAYYQRHRDNLPFEILD